MRVAAAKLAQRGLGQNNSAGVFQFLDHRSVSIRVIVLEQHRAERCRHSLYIRLVFYDDRNSVQRTDKAGCLECGIEPVGFCERFRMDADDGIKGGSLLVIGVDTIEIHLDQLTGCQLSRFVGGVNLIDRCLENVESGYCGAHRQSPLFSWTPSGKFKFGILHRSSIVQFYVSRVCQSVNWQGPRRKKGSLNAARSGLSALCYSASQLVSVGFRSLSCEVVHSIHPHTYMRAFCDTGFTATLTMLNYVL